MASIRRLRRCLSTERRATFLDTTAVALPSPGWALGRGERVTEKCVLSRRRPRPWANSARGTRRERGSMRLNRELGATFATATGNNLLSRRTLGARKEAVGLGALTLLGLVGSFRHSVSQ